MAVLRLLHGRCHPGLHLRMTDGLLFLIAYAICFGIGVLIGWIFDL
jgi:uncharacterized protein YebE (UPF0316 family)